MTNLLSSSRSTSRATSRRGSIASQTCSPALNASNPNESRASGLSITQPAASPGSDARSLAVNVPSQTGLPVPPMLRVSSTGSATSMPLASPAAVSVQPQQPLTLSAAKLLAAHEALLYQLRSTAKRCALLLKTPVESLPPLHSQSTSPLLSSSSSPSIKTRGRGSEERR